MKPSPGSVVETQRGSSVSKLRLFIALELPGAMKDELKATQERLKQKLKSTLKWVRPKGIHLTLKFLGYVDESRVASIEQALAGAVAGHQPLGLHLRGLGSFGGRRPRVIWAGVEGQGEEITALQKSVDGAMAGLGFEPEVQPYNAHLTLARVPEGLSRIQLDDVLHAIAHTQPPKPVDATFSELSLMQSTLRREGAVYRHLHRIPLRA